MTRSLPRDLAIALPAPPTPIDADGDTVDAALLAVIDQATAPSPSGELTATACNQRLGMLWGVQMLLDRLGAAPHPRLVLIARARQRLHKARHAAYAPDPPVVRIRLRRPGGGS